MPNSFNRRDFIKTVTLSGVSIALTNSIGANAHFFDGEFPRIKNEFFSIEFDLSKGVFNISKNSGELFIINATTNLNFIGGKRTITSNSYRHYVETKRVDDKLGSGSMLIITSKDLEKKLDFELQLTLYKGFRAVIIEAICTNVSNSGLIVNSIEPISVIGSGGSSMHFAGVKKCITNGALYYDTGMIHTFGTQYKKPEPYGETKGGKLSSTVINANFDTAQSWWNAGLFSGYDKEGLAMGYIENNLGLGRLLISKTGLHKIEFVAESVFAPGCVLKPGQRISSNRFMINTDSNPYSVLETYAGVLGTLSNARTHSIANGWCNWFYTYEHISEAEVIRNAEFASHHIKDFGFEFIQIDEGYQRWHGDWEGNERFPHGMKWLADKIKGFGLKPGLWIAPFLISEPTWVFQNHPEWLLKHPDGSLKRVGPWPDENTDWARNENPKRYGLDITHPGAAKWLFELLDMVVNKWGYEMVKIDFVAWSLLSADHFYDLSVTPAQAYKKGLEIIRSAVGQHCHLLDCGPGPVSAGLIDSMRIELDQNYGYSKEVWKQYFQDSSCSAAAVAKRYYFHKKAWINDADHICINLLSYSQAEAAATIIALSGGNVISGDRLPELDITRLEILKKIMPSFGEAALPVDLFDSDIQSTFALKIKKPFASWTVAGFFNPDLSVAVQRKFPIERLWLDPKKTYLAYDFWKEKFGGEISGDINISVQPGSVTLLALHEKTSVPQILSTSRHVLQGALELESVSWDSVTKTLSGVSIGPKNSSHSVAVYLPDTHLWKQGGNVLFREYDSYSLKIVDDNIMRVYLRFTEKTTVNWKIKYEEFF